MGRVSRRRLRERPSRPFAVSPAQGKRLLLDTHALLWWFEDDRRLSPVARRAIRTESTLVFVSAASVWEIAIKIRLGKLSDPRGLIDSLSVHLAAQRFQQLPVTIEHARRAGLLAGPHKDPFDRMLIAQAQTEGLAIVSIETPFDTYGVERIW